MGVVGEVVGPLCDGVGWRGDVNVFAQGVFRKVMEDERGAKAGGDDSCFA